VSARMEAGGLNELIAVLHNAGVDAVSEARKVTAKAALNIKNDAKKKASGIRHAPHYPRAISYDTAVRGTTVTAKIGPDKDRPQGALGNILEYGTSKNPPYAHLGPALDYEAPNLERYLGELGEGLLS
jgi:hypothetical protein